MWAPVAGWTTWVFHKGRSQPGQGHACRPLRAFWELHSPCLPLFPFKVPPYTYLFPAQPQGPCSGSHDDGMAPGGLPGKHSSFFSQRILRNLQTEGWCQNAFFFFFFVAPHSMWYLKFPYLGLKPGTLHWTHRALTPGSPGVSLDLLIPSDSHDGHRASSEIRLLETCQPLGWNRHMPPCIGSSFSNYSVTYCLQNPKAAGWQHPSASLHTSGRWHPFPRFPGCQFSSGGRPSPPRASWLMLTNISRPFSATFSAGSTNEATSGCPGSVSSHTDMEHTSFPKRTSLLICP